MLLRLVAIAATLALVMPTLAVAEQNNQHQKSGRNRPRAAASRRLASAGNRLSGKAAHPAAHARRSAARRTATRRHRSAARSGQPGRASIHLARPRVPSRASGAVRVSERLGVPALGGRRGVATAVSDGRLLLCRLGHAWPRSPAAGLPMGAIWAGSSSGERHHRRGRRYDLRRIRIGSSLPGKQRLHAGGNVQGSNPACRTSHRLLPNF